MYSCCEFPYIIRFVHQHLDFRIPELLSLCELFNVKDKLKLPADLSFFNNSPFLPVGGIPLEILIQIVSRAILIQNLYKCYGVEASFESLISATKSSDCTMDDVRPFSTSRFKFIFDIFGSTLSSEQQRTFINKFAFLPLNGPIDLVTPEVTFVVFGCLSSSTWNFDQESWYFGRLIAKGGRSLMDLYDLKKRAYIGITSMDAELSLVMSNMALVRPGSLLFDPFVGTGSFLLTGAHFGGLTIGCDIDGRQIRGREGSTIQTNAIQYGLTSRIIGTFVCDITQNPLRPNLEVFDAIITDPPYGIRAGAKKITALDSLPASRKVRDCMTPAYPKTNPYPTSQVYADLVQFAACYLVVGGRLVFWIPSTDEDGGGFPLEIPKHPAMKIFAKSEQKMKKWSRWLVTMEKTHSPSVMDRTASIPSRFFRPEYFRCSQ